MVATRVVPGAAAMWDLTVSQVHTFAVGTGEFVVHNNRCTGGDPTNTLKPGPYARESIPARAVQSVDSHLRILNGRRSMTLGIGMGATPVAPRIQERQMAAGSRIISRPPS